MSRIDWILTQDICFWFEVPGRRPLVFCCDTDTVRQNLERQIKHNSDHQNEPLMKCPSVNFKTSLRLECSNFSHLLNISSGRRTARLVWKPNLIQFLWCREAVRASIDVFSWKKFRFAASVQPDCSRRGSKKVLPCILNHFYWNFEPTRAAKRENSGFRIGCIYSLGRGERPWIIGIYPVKGCYRYFPLDPQQSVQYKWSCSRMLTKYRLLLQSGRREDDRWRRLVQTEISCLRARVWRSAPAGWLDAHTNLQLHLSDAKDHLGARTCRGGAGKWFMPRSSGLRWSQRKQLQWRWYIPSVCMWLREGWGQEKKIKYRAGTWAGSVCMQGLWFLSWGKRRWYNTGRSRGIVRRLRERWWNIITLL